MANRDIYSTKVATVKDFSGGLNANDNPHNLSSRFQTVSDNVVVGTDATLSPRFGYELFSELDNLPGGFATVKTGSTSITLSFTNGSGRVTVTHVAHDLTSGHHITLSGYVGSVIPASEINTEHGVRVIDVDTYVIECRTPANATTTAAFTAAWESNQDYIGGNIIEAVFFQDHLVVFSDIGEIASIDEDGTPTLIWSTAIAYAQSGNPTGWRPCRRISTDTMRETLIAVNGRTNDKPVEISFSRASGDVCQFLVDPASGSNANVPRGDIVQCFNGYTLIYGTDDVSGPFANDTYVDISAVGTTGVFASNPAPDDAVQLDLGRISQALAPQITGATNIRDRVVVTFYDSSLLGRLGIINTGVHEPTFDDQIPQVGALNHRVIANIGNDVLMCDYAGVPAFTQSLQSGAIVPDRHSFYIEPMLNRHLTRLSQDQLRYDVFAIYNVRDKQYMLFVPEYDDERTVSIDYDGVYMLSDFLGTNYVLIKATNHLLEEGAIINISGISSITGYDVATHLNGNDRRVAFVIDDDFFIVEGGEPVDTAGVQGGGGNGSFVVQNNKKIAYVYTLNVQQRIKRWTRFLDLDFDAGCVSAFGRVFFAKGKRVYRFGTQAEPVYTDRRGERDKKYLNGRLFLVGDLVGDTTGKVYRCLVEYTPTALSLAAAVAAHPDNWEEYTGEAISFAAETPWSDFGDRDAMKQISNVAFDAIGRNPFTFSIFVDNIYKDTTTLELSPECSMQFVPKDYGGWGIGPQVFGGGRRTREQLPYALPARCKIAKLRFEGTATDLLKIVGVTMQYKKGSTMR